MRQVSSRRYTLSKYTVLIITTKKFWINDIYVSLFHFWHMCRNNPNKLISQIREWKKSIEITLQRLSASFRRGDLLKELNEQE